MKAMERHRKRQWRNEQRRREMYVYRQPDPCRWRVPKWAHIGWIKRRDEREEKRLAR